MFDASSKLVVLLYIVQQFSVTCYHFKNEISSMYDILEPYRNYHNRAGGSKVKRDVSMNESSSYEVYNSHNSSNFYPVSSTRYFVSYVPHYPDSYSEKITAYGHITKINNPFRTFSVIEPGGPLGCQNNTREFVEETAKLKHCYVAQNGGYFNTTSGCCLGNLVVDGKVIQDNGGVINAHFGILKNSSIIIGYIPEYLIRENKFEHLIGGVGWIVRDGSSFVEKSVKIESDKFEETGTFDYFANVQSARTAIGYNKDGQVVLVNVEGQTGSRGLNLYQMAHLLINEFKVINAINLDGGGSATLVLNGSVANYPSDHCKDDPEWRCPRKVSSVVCVHEPRCLTECVHGECVNGICKCDYNHIGEDCSILKCGHHNCSNHGTCYLYGCDCDSGWDGSDCNIPCAVNFFGKNCTQKCTCRNNATCNTVTGRCECLPGFHGDNCGDHCLGGTYGKNCEFDCNCPDTCSCDSITGVCTNSSNVNLTSISWKAALCYKNILQEVHIIVKPTEFQWAYVGTIGYVFLCASIVFNIILLWKLFRISDPKICEDSSTDTDEYETVPLVQVNTENKSNWKNNWLDKIKDYKMKTKYNGYTPLNKNNNFKETALR